MSHSVYIYKTELGEIWISDNLELNSAKSLAEYLKGLNGLKTLQPIVIEPKCTVIESSDASIDFQWIPGVANQKFHAQHINVEEEYCLFLLDQSLAEEWMKDLKKYPQFLEPKFIPKVNELKSDLVENIDRLAEVNPLRYDRSIILDFTHWVIRHRIWVAGWFLGLIAIQVFNAYRSDYFQSLLPERNALNQQIELLEGKKEVESMMAFSTPHYTYALDRLNGVRNDKVEWRSVAAMMDLSNPSNNQSIEIGLVLRFENWDELNEWITDIKGIAGVSQCIIRSVDEKESTAEVQIKITV